MLLHKQRVSFYVSGEDEQQNEIAMGQGPVCPTSSITCGYRPGEVLPDWDADLVTYDIRQEFEPEVDLGNSSILGHDDYEPLHPGVHTTKSNSWTSTDGRTSSTSKLVQDFDDDESSMFIHCKGC